MKILLDTHIVLWSLLNNPKLPEQAKIEISDKKNAIFVSVVSLWEVAIKHAKFPEDISISAEELASYFGSAGYEFLGLTAPDIYELERLKQIEGTVRHNDPFDRILISQSIANNMKFITCDEKMKYYELPNIESFKPGERIS